MSDKNSHSQHEHVAAGGATKRKGGFKRHCGRFWWVYLLVLIVITVIVVPVIILVAIPKIAQSKLDEAELTIESVRLTNTKSNSYTLSIDSVIKSDGKIHAVIAGFHGQMYLEDVLPHRPFVFVDFPETTSVKEQVVNVSQIVDISDMAAFTTFNTWFQNNETLRVTMYGETFVHVSGISREYPVVFKKTLTILGLNGLKGMNVTDPAVAVQGDARGDNFHGITNIPNPSVFTLEIGNTTYHTYLAGAEVGTIFVDNLILRPGLNTFPVRANVSNGPVLTAVQTRPYCEKGLLPFTLNAWNPLGVVNNGQELSYFNDALATATLAVDIDIGGAVAKLLGRPTECSA